MAVLELSKFSDKLVATGVMSKNRLIVPSFRRLWKWFKSIWDTTEQALADDDRTQFYRRGQIVVWGYEQSYPQY
jgi:hypothetical protein